MYKVLWIGNFLENSGWGTVGLNGILALDSTGIDLVLRPISFGEQIKKVTPRITELMNKDINNVDVCILHTLPTLYTFSGAYTKNIGFYEAETNDYSSSLWQKYCNLMDSVWVPSELNRKQAQVSGVTVPISVVNHCIEWDRYQNFEPTADIEQLKDGYNFCFVGELSKRKNITAILRAFHTEFHPSENVNLFLKINKPGFSGPDCLKLFNESHQAIKDGLKIRASYKEPVVVAEHLPYIHLLSFMSQCHCFVSASYGESWCQPALDSLAMGLNLLYTACTGTEEFAQVHGAQPIKSHEVPCWGAVETLPEIYSAYDRWQEIDVDALAFGMRNMYEQRNNQNRKEIAESVRCFDFREVGKRMVEAIYA